MASVTFAGIFLIEKLSRIASITLLSSLITVAYKRRKEPVYAKTRRR